MKTACISVKTLYEHFGEKLTYGIIEKDYGSNEESDRHYYDLYNMHDDMIACMDGENVQIVEENETSIKFLNTDGEKDVEFLLSREEFEIASFQLV